MTAMNRAEYSRSPSNASASPGTSGTPTTSALTAALALFTGSGSSAVSLTSAGAALAAVVAGNPQDDIRVTETVPESNGLPYNLNVRIDNAFDGQYGNYNHHHHDDEGGNEGNMELVTLLPSPSETSASTPTVSHTSKKYPNKMTSLHRNANLGQMNTTKSSTDHIYHDKSDRNDRNDSNDRHNNRRAKHHNNGDYRNIYHPSSPHRSHAHRKHRRRRRMAVDEDPDVTILQSLLPGTSPPSDDDHVGGSCTISACTSPTNVGGPVVRRNRFFCCCRNFKATLQCMNLLARIVLWLTCVALIVAVIWYSYELHNHGTDAHYIAWFSAGAFVLLGFPVSMWGIVGHLANYNQPAVQVYVVRILAMVPIYSVESWLAMRFHKQAIYIETLRDFYESYVLYSFLQFLIEVLGGEDNLVLMLKDKSPTRGVHMWGFQWCIKPWLMGQPVRRDVSKVSINKLLSPSSSNHGPVQPPQRQHQQLQISDNPTMVETISNKSNNRFSSINNGGHCISGGQLDHNMLDDSTTPHMSTLIGTGGVLTSSTSQTIIHSSATGNGGTNTLTQSHQYQNNHHRHQNRSKRVRSMKKVIWESPFFKHCKFGVLQYVLLKLICAVVVLVLEWKGWYREGHFDWRSGYLYICFLTNLSQCWALYTLIFFYYATKNELSPIRPVGKFLSVKALVFFTWWQSVFISCLYQMDMIPKYTDEWTSEHVAKGIQDYLICVEMFVAAVVHVFVFPHSEYSPAAVEARQRAVHNARKPSSNFYGSGYFGRKRLGRQRLYRNNLYYTRPWREIHNDDVSSKDSNLTTSVDDIVSSNTDNNNKKNSINDSFESSITTNSINIDIDDIDTALANKGNTSSKKYSPSRSSSQPLWSSSITTNVSPQRCHSWALTSPPQPLQESELRFSESGRSPKSITGITNEAQSFSVADLENQQQHLVLRRGGSSSGPTRWLKSDSLENTSSVASRRALASYSGNPIGSSGTTPPTSSSIWEEVDGDNDDDNKELAFKRRLISDASSSIYQHDQYQQNSTQQNIVMDLDDYSYDSSDYTDDDDDDDFYDYDEDDNYGDDDDYDDDYNNSKCDGFRHNSARDARTRAVSSTSPLTGTNTSRTATTSTAVVKQRPGFVRALLDTAIPLDLHNNTVGIVKGEYHVEKKTLLHHAATSDQYDLFSNRRRITKQQLAAHHQRSNNNTSNLPAINNNSR